MKLDFQPRSGQAAYGKYLPAHRLLRREPLCSPEQSSPPALELEDCQTFISHDEQHFYDWCLGILEDSGVTGILKNERLYLASECHAELDVGDTTYEVELSQTFINFAHKDMGELRLLFPDTGATTDGETLETSHVRQAFDAIRRQSVLNRFWAASTDLVSAPAVGIGNLRLDDRRALVAMDVESGMGECTVRISRGTDVKSFRYSVTEAVRSMQFSPRIADALLSDVADELGGCPQPETLLNAMMGTYTRAQNDHEWLTI